MSKWKGYNITSSLSTSLRFGIIFYVAHINLTIKLIITVILAICILGKGEKFIIPLKRVEMRKYLSKLFITSALSATLIAPGINAVDYVIDTRGAHAAINFKIKHLGYSWLTGRFDKFSGKFSYDADNISASTIEINIDTRSINTNHAERDKHLRDDDYLNVSSFSKAKFVSSSITQQADKTLVVKGILTLHGVSKEIVIDAEAIGEGRSPWFDYRAGFSGTTSIALADLGITKDLGPASSHVYFDLHIEGIKQKRK